MRPKSIFIAGIVLLVGFGLFMGVSILSNVRLRTYFETHTRANHLLVSWNRTEILTKELFLTYDLLKVRRKWQNTIRQFDADFQSFLNAPVIQAIVAGDTGFAVDVAMIEMYWQVISGLLQNADQQMETFLAAHQRITNSGNLLVDFGENWATGRYVDPLIDTISALRSCVSLSQASFTEALTQLSRHAAADIRRQSQRLQMIYILLSALLLSTVGIFIVYRIRTLTRSREAAHRFAQGLQKEIEERNRTAALLQAERDKLQGVLNAMGDGMYIVDSRFNIEYQNDIMLRDFGEACDEKCFRKYGGVDAPCSFCRALSAIKSGKLQIAEAVLDDGKNWEVTYSPYVDVDGSVKAIALWSDITEKKKIEAEAARAGHLASLGELSAGVAHEINNPINGIINYAERLENRLCQLGPDADIPGRIIKEGERIAVIVRNLLSFASSREERRRPVPVKDILGDTLGLVERQIAKDGICLNVALAARLPQVKVRPQEIQQVFLNIISNARYALRRNGAGAQDRVKHFSIRGEAVNENGRRFVRIEFHDNGGGISKPLLEKICLPFFSTKPKGEGTGLGLSISHGIISSHGGRMSFDSEEGAYTRVTIDLPVES